MKKNIKLKVTTNLSQWHWCAYSVQIQIQKQKKIGFYPRMFMRRCTKN